MKIFWGVGKAASKYVITREGDRERKRMGGKGEKNLVGNLLKILSC